MKKLILVLPVIAVLCFANAVKADNGAIDNATLSAMGLGGVEVISDQEAMKVRGQGFFVGTSAALAFGASFSTIDSPFGATGTVDGFFADGRYHAAGSHQSESVASLTTSSVETVDVAGVIIGSTTITDTITFRIGSAGSSSSVAF